MNIKGLLERAGRDRDIYGDLHVLRFFSSFITVSRGKVIKVTEPAPGYCPLAAYLYKEIRRLDGRDTEKTRRAIKKIVERKISEFGVFTENRKFFSYSIAIPYGASEILMYAARKNIIDAAVLVCDGAGTVIASKPEVIQGIGARMNGLFFTSSVDRVREKLKNAGCELPFQDASIDQAAGVEIAAKRGYKNIAVTINALMYEDFRRLRDIERQYAVTVTVLAICTTSATGERLRQISEYSDIVWSCASEEARVIFGKNALIQLSKKIPVFVLTQQGLAVIEGYVAGSGLKGKIDPRKQYIIDSAGKGARINIGCFKSYLREERLPVRTREEPRFAGNSTVPVV